MATATKPEPEPITPPQNPIRTVAELLKQLGGISPHRVHLIPTPGTATEQDVLEEAKAKRFCELLDGVLVEKVMGFSESRLASLLIIYLGAFVQRGKLGIVAGEGSMTRLFPGRLRIPDVAFVSRERFSRRKKRHETILEFAPDLVVEILSKSNTRREMEQKLRDYFYGGTRLVWYIDPKKRIVRAYTGPGEMTILTEDQTLDGGDVVPGFALPLRDLFAELDR